MVLGLYFALVRPALLPEDVRYLHTSFEHVERGMPLLTSWLRRVFWVLGGSMFAFGLVTLYVAVTAFQKRAPGAAAVVAVAGLASVANLAVVNFLIASHFRWQLLMLAILWMLAFLFYYIENPSSVK